MGLSFSSLSPRQRRASRWSGAMVVALAVHALVLLAVSRSTPALPEVPLRTVDVFLYSPEPPPPPPAEPAVETGAARLPPLRSSASRPSPRPRSTANWSLRPSLRRSQPLWLASHRRRRPRRVRAWAGRGPARAPVPVKVPVPGRARGPVRETCGSRVPMPCGPIIRARPCAGACQGPLSSAAGSGKIQFWTSAGS